MEEYIKLSLIRPSIVLYSLYIYLHSETLYLSPIQMDAAHWSARKPRLAIQSALAYLEAVLRQAGSSPEKFGQKLLAFRDFYDFLTSALYGRRYSCSQLLVLSIW